MNTRLPCVMNMPDPRHLPPFGERPAIVFLHGVGECGDGDGKQVEVGLGPGLRGGAARGCVVAFPQKPSGGEWEDHADQIAGLLEDLVFEYGVAGDEITLTGISHGGHGCWGLAIALPNRWKCIVPVCGYLERWQPEDSAQSRPSRRNGPVARRLAAAVGDTPVRIYHGTNDPAVDIEESRTAARLLSDAGANVELFELVGLDHHCWDEAYRREFGVE